MKFDRKYPAAVRNDHPNGSEMLKVWHALPCQICGEMTEWFSIRNFRFGYVCSEECFEEHADESQPWDDTASTDGPSYKTNPTKTI